MIAFFRKFFRFAGSQSSKWKKGILFTVLKSFFSSFQLFAIAIVLKAVASNNVNADTALQSFAAMLISVTGTIIMQHLAHRNESRGGYLMCADKRTEIGQHLKVMPMGYFNSHSLGNITSTATTTMEDIENTAPKIIVNYLNGIIQSVIFAVCMLMFNVPVGLFTLLGILVFLAVNTMLQKKARRVSERRQEAQTKMVDAVLEYIQGMSVVKAFRGSTATRRAVESSVTACVEKNIGLEKTVIPYMAAQQLILRIFSSGIITVSVFLCLQGKMEVFICLLLVLSGFLVYNQLEAGGSMSAFLRLIDASMDRVMEVLDTPVMESGDQKIDNKKGNLDITFENVSFSYENKKILDNICIRIPENSTTAIIGPSGAGKTTLCNLIARFWDADQGRITLGGIDIRDLPVDQLMEHISMVFQNVYLFHDTIAANIKFGRPEATEQEVMLAAKKANCHEFIMQLPKGYDTVLGEGGATISGGEKQRISIARALLKDAPIVILDEATANVDPENEYELIQAVRVLTKEKTVIMIAHRLKTVREADQILVMDEGRIVQCGTHEKLIKVPGIYADFIGIRARAASWKVTK